MKNRFYKNPKDQFYYIINCLGRGYIAHLHYATTITLRPNVYNTT